MRVRKRRKPDTGLRTQRMHRTNGNWPTNQVRYEVLEKLKEVVCRIQHPNLYFRHFKQEIRVSILRWSRGSYLDIRNYRNGSPTGVGILLHVDIASKLLPDIVGAIRRMELEDSREDTQKQRITVVHA